MGVVQIRMKNVYGNELAYPANDTAKLFAKLTNNKVLTPSALNVIRELAYKVEVVL